MKFSGPLIVVSNMEKSKSFYNKVLNLEVIIDFGANVVLTGGIILQTKDTWVDFIHKQDSEIILDNNAGELYYEEDDFDSFIQKLNNINDIDYVHPIKEHSWGQRVVRFYDPDKHIIEVGENMIMVVRRFINRGISVEKTAAIMGASIDYVNSCLE